jgi:hypothetical protein
MALFDGQERSQLELPGNSARTNPTTEGSASRGSGPEIGERLGAVIPVFNEKGSDDGDGAGDDMGSLGSDNESDFDNCRAWMLDALQTHLMSSLNCATNMQLEGNSVQKGEKSVVEVSGESLDALIVCLESIMDKVLDQAKRFARYASPESQGSRVSELTSLDIHKAIKALFPGDENRERSIRPYLPRMTKVAWKMDKESLPKGVKKRKKLG